MGGVGKTQLALEYAYRHAGDLDLVWWLRAEEPATLLEHYAALADPLGLAQASEIAATVAAVRQALTRRDRWLLVFDNANAPNEIDDLLPRGAGGRVLITSRNPSWPFAAELGVPTLSREAAVRFLLQRTGQRDAASAAALADELGDLPLALAQAAAYIVETGSALADHLHALRTKRRALRARQRPPDGYPGTVGTTWTMAAERLRTEEPRALDLLSLCAFLAPEAIPRRLLSEHHAALPPDLGAALADALDLDRLLAALRRYSLADVTPGTLSCHRLVQAATRDALAPDDHRRWIETAVALMRAAFPYDRDVPATWAPSGGLLAHALAAAGHAEAAARDLADARWLLNQTAHYFERRAEFDQARSGYARAQALAEAALGENDPEVASYINNLGSVLRALGDLAGARAAFDRALRIDEASFGPDHPKVASSVNNLGSVLPELGDLAGARAAFERALRIDEASFGADDPMVAIRVNNLGSVLQDLGDLAGARAAYERALRIDEASFGPDHPNVAISVNNLGSVLQDLGDLAGARAAFERALRIDEASFGPDHPNVARDVNNLGSVLRDLGDLAGARAAFERALRIDEASFGPDHPNVAIRVNNLGDVLRALGDLAGARAAFERALAICERFHGPEHPHTRIARGNLESLGRG
jgi:tetratricopeptide (TPR) repeat protein